MTTPIYPSITDELLAELEEAAKYADTLQCSNPDMSCEFASPATILALIARVRELEAREVELPPPFPMPEADEWALDDSHMDPYYAANGMRSACKTFIEAVGVRVKQ